MGFKYIIVIIDTFTRYVELFPKQEVTAIAAADDRVISKSITVLEVRLLTGGLC